MREVRSSYEIPSCPQDLPDLVVAKASMTSDSVIKDGLGKDPTRLWYKESAKSVCGGDQEGYISSDRKVSDPAWLWRFRLHVQYSYYELLRRFVYA